MITPCVSDGKILCFSCNSTKKYKKIPYAGHIGYFVTFVHRHTEFLTNGENQ